MTPDPFLSVLLVFGLLGLLMGLVGAFKRSAPLLVLSGFLVLGATSFAVTALALA